MIATRLGAYDVVGKLGEGGMGEVYRARDTKLNRDVAIKILPELFARDPDRVARFEREAQTLAALNHTNIAQVFAVLENPAALVMELVDGEDLSAIIAREPMPIADVLRIATQLAEGLEAAHELGIVHRDLKPAKIKLRVDGTVKILDFGLAKAMDAGGGAAVGAATMQSPTFTSPAQMTQMGMIHLFAISHDERDVAWEAHAKGTLTLMRRPADGSSPGRVLRPWGKAGGPVDWSPDGRAVLYASDDGVGGDNLWNVPATAPGRPSG